MYFISRQIFEKLHCLSLKNNETKNYFEIKRSEKKSLYISDFVTKHHITIPFTVISPEKKYRLTTDYRIDLNVTFMGCGLQLK